VIYKSCYISSSGISDCLDAGAEAINWKNQWKPPSQKSGRFRRGLGVAIFCMGAGRPGPGNNSSAMVKVYPDGTASLFSALADIGQGQHTVQTQIVAEVLGITYQDVNIVCHDTDSTPWATIVANSCGTWIQGWATYEAAMEAKRKLLDLAALKLEVNPEKLEVKDSIIFDKSNPEKKLNFKDAFGPFGIYGGNHEIVGYHNHESPHPRCFKDEKKIRSISPKRKGRSLYR
jgi:xanthine dehydrogenase molybdenum-binding subunit